MSWYKYRVRLRNKDEIENTYQWFDCKDEREAIGRLKEIREAIEEFAEDIVVEEIKVIGIDTDYNPFFEFF
jgi:hypothetical protein